MRPPSSDADLVSMLRAAGCVFAEDEAALLVAAAGTPDELAALAARRIAGEPLEQVLGWAEFRGLKVGVTPGVFVPRQRTAILVTHALPLVTALHGEVADPGEAATSGRVLVVDLCCGTGALGLALATEARAAGVEVELHAADVDPVAVGCAGANLAGVGTVHGGDLFDALPDGLRGRIAVLLANVPYVPTGEIAYLPPEARDHEARVALDGGGDGLDVLRRVAAEAPRWLAPGGHLLTESGERQAIGAVEVLESAGFTAHVVRDDEVGATGVIGTLPAAR